MPNNGAFAFFNATEKQSDQMFTMYTRDVIDRVHFVIFKKMITCS